jgi:hypothetical protein
MQVTNRDGLDIDIALDCIRIGTDGHNWIVQFLLPSRSEHLSVPEVQKENDKEQDRWERHHERDGTEPSEHKRAVAGTGRGQGNSNDVMKSSEQFCEEFDHSCPR